MNIADSRGNTVVSIIIRWNKIKDENEAKINIIHSHRDESKIGLTKLS